MLFITCKALNRNQCRLVGSKHKIPLSKKKILNATCIATGYFSMEYLKRGFCCKISLASFKLFYFAFAKKGNLQ